MQKREDGDAIDILVVVPTKGEFKGIQEFLETELKGKGFRLPSARDIVGQMAIYTKASSRNEDKPYRVGLFQCGDTGNVASAAMTAFALGRHNPHLLISAGIAGSLNPERLFIGDIVFPSSVENTAVDKIYSPETTTSPENSLRIGDDKLFFARLKESKVIELNNENLIDHYTRLISSEVESEVLKFNRFNELAKDRERLSKILMDRRGVSVSDHNFKILKSERTFSWGKVLDNYELYSTLVKKEKASGKAICVEMESWGLAYLYDILGTEFNKPLVIRAISDLVGLKVDGDDKNDKDFEGPSRQYAMHNLAVAISKIVHLEYERVTSG